jgi:Tfp pilus assembly protein FimT
LTELAVVMALIGVVAAVAFTASAETRAGARGFADQVSGELEAARMRALSTRRWHRVTVTDRGALTEQASTTGMVAPVAYEWVDKISAPAPVRIVAVATSTVVNAGGPRNEGEGFTEEFLFAPDGSSVPRTLWVSDRKDRAVYRVAVYGATGRARVFEGW